MTGRDNFDKLFGRLPETMTRGEDGKIVMDTKHPVVHEMVESIREFLSAGGTVEQVMKIWENVWHAKQRRRKHGR